MAKEREEEDFKRSETDRIAIINKINKEKQKLNDLNSLLNRKKHRDNITNQYKRKDCAPVNLFDAGYLKKDIKDIKLEGDETNENQLKIKSEAVQKESEMKPATTNKAELLRIFHEKILSKANEIDELFQKKKESSIRNTNNNNLNNEINNSKYNFSGNNNSTSSSNEPNVIFSIMPFDASIIVDLIKQNNRKVNINESKRYTLQDIDV